MRRFEVDGNGVTTEAPVKPTTVSRSGRDHLSGATATVLVEYRPGQGRAALRLLSGLVLRLLLDVKARP